VVREATRIRVLFWAVLVCVALVTCVVQVNKDKIPILIRMGDWTYYRVHFRSHNFAVSDVQVKKSPRVAKAKPVDAADASVAEVLDGLRDAMGVENAMLLGSDDKALKIRGVVSTGIPTLDAAIGRGGAPLGRLTILHGGEGSGKTTIGLQLVARCQAMGGLAVFFDKEFKLDPDYAVALGVDTKRLIISQPSSLELVIQGILNVIAHAKNIRDHAKRRVPIMIVLDSLNACMSKEAMEAPIGEKQYPAEARIWSQQLPKIIQQASHEDVSLLFVSQVRKKFNVMFGDADEIAGGNAPRFYASLIMKVVRVGSEKDGKQRIANKIEVECKKNQIAPPFKKAQFNIVYGRGADFEHALVIQLEKMKLFTRKGAWYLYEGEKLGNGLQATADMLRKTSELREEFTDLFRTEMGWEK
jgi:recombination protein RecA